MLHPFSFKKGFTLAELLIALAILGVIATFTIPKILSSQQNGQFNAVAKEDIAMLSGAYQLAQLAGTVTSSTTPSDLTPYMNYIALDTTSTIDALHGLGVAVSCSGGQPCLRMHNGSIIQLYHRSFGGTATNNAILVLIDPDGRQTSSTTNGAGKMMEAFIYYDGRIGSRGTLHTTAISSDGPRPADPNHEPSWFSW
ncbi:type II secretion system protein [Vampirovibrio sp.]|uniref:type II secretion system protein n=1 Tax=Vampirovibrio sp. TaxID=2717857 RepID=UPI00359368A5